MNSDLVKQINEVGQYTTTVSAGFQELESTTKVKEKLPTQQDETQTNKSH